MKLNKLLSLALIGVLSCGVAGCNKDNSPADVSNSIIGEYVFDYWKVSGTKYGDEVETIYTTCPTSSVSLLSSDSLLDENDAFTVLWSTIVEASCTPYVDATITITEDKFTITGNKLGDEQGSFDYILDENANIFLKLTGKEGYTNNHLYAFENGKLYAVADNENLELANEVINSITLAFKRK